MPLNYGGLIMLILYYSVFWAGGLTLHNKQYLILSYLIERLHKQFCISVLNVKRSTNYFAIYGELARFPLIIERHIQIVKYVLKLDQTKNVYPF